MASAAMLADNTYTEARALPVVDRYVSAETRAPSDAQKIERIETELAPGLAIETTIPANPILIETLMRLHDLKALGPNWDGYGARAVDLRAFRPALMLAIEAVQRCQCPTIVALSDGGLGLRLEAENKALEIDIAPAGTVQAFFQFGEVETELAPGSSLDKGGELLHRYCRV